LSDRLGNFYPPTILTDIHLAAQPIKKNFWSGGAVIQVADIDAAIAANGTPFGLGASAWTTDAIAISELEAGAVLSMTWSSPIHAFPLGGILGTDERIEQPGIHEFVNVKTVWVR